MAINKPKQFDALYQCSIESFKQIMREPVSYDNLSSPDTIFRTKEIVVEFVNIKMSREEYERFNQNWEQYLTLMIVARDNPRIKEEYHKLLMMTNLLA